MKTQKQTVADTAKPPKPSKQTPPSSNNDTGMKIPVTKKDTDVGNTYTYILTTQEQRQDIKLTQHKPKLEMIIKRFFGERLTHVSFTDESYTLTIKDAYTIGDKRRLGRLISEGSDLQKFVKKVIYNGNKDTSGQLFKLLKPSESQHASV